MRPVYIIIALSIFSFCCGQGFRFHDIKHQSAYTGANPYLELLGITDTNALIIKATLNHENSSDEGSYIAFRSNGEIHRYGIFNINNEIVVKHISITNPVEKQSLHNTLQVVSSLDQSQLDIKEIVYNGVSTSVYINDAGNYYLTIYKGDRLSHFQSEAPHEYIDAKVEGYEMRALFLQLFNAVDYKKAIQTKDINEIRKRDTIYVYYQKGPYETKMTMTQTGLGLYQFAIDNREHFNFTEVKNAGKYVSNSKELQHIRETMIDYDFFFKYGAEAQFLRSKKVFIVDALELSQNKVKLKEVKVSFPYPKL